TAALEIAARSPSFTVSTWLRALDGNRISIATDKTQTTFLLTNSPFNIPFLLRDCRCRTRKPYGACNMVIQRVSMRAPASDACAPLGLSIENRPLIDP